MDNAYFQQFTDDRIRQRLPRRDTLGQMEAVLEHDQGQIAQLATLPDATEYGDRLDEAEALQLLSIVCAEVDTVLGVSDLQPPPLVGARLFSRQYAPIAAAFGGGCACLAPSAALLCRKARRKTVPAAEGVPSRRLSRRD